jgi:hypothetical protein
MTNWNHTVQFNSSFVILKTPGYYLDASWGSRINEFRGRKQIVAHSQKPALAYYITSHGYGHGVRSGSIIGALHRLYPNLSVHIVSELPSALLANQAGKGRHSFRTGSFDVGMVQLDSIRVDVEATLSRIEQLYSRRKELVEQEREYLAGRRITLVVADIPGIPIEAAASMGIPSLAIGNFAWDWIYSEFVPRNPRWRPIVESYREEYGLTGLLLRLPFCEEMRAFPRKQDIPLVASPGISRRAEIAQLTGCDQGRKWVLLCFTALDWGPKALSNVARLADYEFFTVRPLEWLQSNIHVLDREQVSFSDVLASVDAVISKPGFGIVSDCIVNERPLIYADRTDFMEYAILVSAIQKYLKNTHIPSSDLYRGELRESLERIWDVPDPEAKLARGGDVIAARHIANYF